MAFTPVTALLVTDNTLQEYLVNKQTGLPLTSGVLTFYRDQARTTLKNVYYQVQVGNTYDYIALPNPLTLSAVGTVVDVNGNDTKIFFYPYLETDSATADPYYITVYDQNGTLQFTRENFPFVVESSTAAQVETLDNYIINGSFFRNGGASPSTAINVSSQTNTVICPSQHAGHLQVTSGSYSAMSDMRFIKSNTSATDSITFSNISAGTILTGSTNPFNVDVTPYYQLNFQCTAAGTETYKYIQIPVALKQKNLGGSEVTVTIWAMCAANSNPNVSLKMYQFLGTGQGQTSPTSLPVATDIDDIVLTTSWTKYTKTFNMPASVDIPSANLTGDDGWYLQIYLPNGASSTCNVYFAKPEFYVGSAYPTNSFESYDEIESVIACPRTGDVRMSLNSFAPYGWVACNDGTIGFPTSGATLASTDCWNLYNLLWTNVNRTFAPLSAGSSGTAYGDWVAGTKISLPKVLGRALLGLPTTDSVTYVFGLSPTWNAGVLGFFTTVDTTLLYPGAPVYLTGTMPTSGPFTANTVYYAIPALDGSNTTQFQLAASYANAIAGSAIPAGTASDGGSNLVINFALAGSFGESRHVQTTNELVTHRHAAPTANFVLSGAGTAYQGAGATGSTTPFTDYTGSSWPANIVQPSTYFNVFLKL